MPNEPNNNAEAMLKSYAEKRRAEAGPPIEPHPVTRQLLHEEIARTFPAPDENRPSWRRLVLGLIPRLGIAGGITAALAVAVYLIHRDNPPGYNMASNEPRSSSPAQTTSESERSLKLAATDEKMKDQALDGLRRAEQDRRTLPQSTLGAGETPKDRSATSGDVQKKMELADTPANRAKAKEEPLAGIVEPAMSEAKKVAAAAAPAPAESQELAKSAPIPAARPADSETRLAVTPSKALASSTPFPSTASPSAPATPPAAPGAPSPLVPPRANSAQVNRASEPKANATLAYGAGTAGAAAGATVQNSQNFYFKEATGELRQNFSQLNQRSQYRANFNSPKPSPVLNSFQLEREGNRVQVTDADGSIYLGAVISTDPAAVAVKSESAMKQTPEAFARAAKPAAAATAQSNQIQNSPSKDAMASPDAGQANFAFRVAGTNRTVKKVVVFNGTLNVDQAQDALSQQTPQLRAAGQAQASQLQNAATANAFQNTQNRFITNQAGMIQNGRLSGQAVVGGREKLPIDAVPAAAP